MERERLQFQGRLVEKELEAKNLNLKAEGLRGTIRMYLDPFAEFDEMDIEVAFQAMTEFADTILKYKELLGEIKAIKKALGK